MISNLQESCANETDAHSASWALAWVWVLTPAYLLRCAPSPCVCNTLTDDVLNSLRIGYIYHGLLLSQVTTLNLCMKEVFYLLRHLYFIFINWPIMSSLVFSLLQ